MAKLKVYGGLVFNGKRKQVRTIVATTSQKNAAALVGCTVSEIRNYWSETGNDMEIATALALPGVVLQASTDMGNDFAPVPENN